MLYAWISAIDFSKGAMPIARARDYPNLLKKMKEQGYKKFFTAHQIDRTWVDLTTYAPGNEDGRMVSEDRQKRYIRGRNRALEEAGQPEVSQNTSMPAPEQDSISVPEDGGSVAALSPKYQEAQATPPQSDVQEVALSIHPAHVTAIYKFLDMDQDSKKAIIGLLSMEQEQREAAAGALAALAEASDAFISGIKVMLEPGMKLTVGFSGPETE